MTAGICLVRRLPENLFFLGLVRRLARGLVRGGLARCHACRGTVSAARHEFTEETEIRIQVLELQRDMPV
jgi:hypothetical protein